MHLRSMTPGGRGEDLYLMANSYAEPHEFVLPKIGSKRWQRFIDTALDWDESIAEPDVKRVRTGQKVCRVEGRSVVVMIAKRRDS